MDIKKWTQKKWVKRAGWVALVLWTAGGAVYLFGRNLFPFIAGLGAFYLVLGLVVLVAWLIYKLAGGRRKELPDLGEIGVMVGAAAVTGFMVTLAQERLIKFPHKFSDPLFYSNVAIVTVFFLLGRASKKGEEERDDD